MNNQLVTVKMPHRNGLERDAVQFSLAMLVNPSWDLEDGFGDFTGPIIDFLTSPDTAGNIVSTHFSKELSRTSSAVEISGYNLDGHLDGSPHGSPLWVAHTTLNDPAVGTTDLPSEVAFCTTLRSFIDGAPAVEAPDGADAGTAPDRPRERHSGRFYLGPLNSQAVEIDANFISRPAATFRTCVRQGVARMDATLNSAGHFLAVWSRKDAVLRSVTQVETDNAWDTQRRRGASATVRETLAT